MATIHPELVSYRLEVARASLAIDEIQVPQVDEEPKALADDEHRVLLGERIGKEQHAAADREEPERHRKDALARAFARDPLHDETQPEQRLADIADQHHPIQVEEEDVVQVVADAV